MLELPLSFFISQKRGEILIFRTFLAKFSIFAFISLKIGYFELGNDYEVTVTSYLGFGMYVGMYGKRRPLVILWYQLDLSGGFHFQVYRGW